MGYLNRAVCPVCSDDLRYERGDPLHSGQHLRGGRAGEEAGANAADTLPRQKQLHRRLITIITPSHQIKQ